MVCSGICDASFLLNCFPLLLSQIGSVQSLVARASPFFQAASLKVGSNQLAVGLVKDAENLVLANPVAVNAFPSTAIPANIPLMTPLSIPWIPTTHGPSPASVWL